MDDNNYTDTTECTIIQGIKGGGGVLPLGADIIVTFYICVGPSKEK